MFGQKLYFDNKFLHKNYNFCALPYFCLLMKGPAGPEVRCIPTHGKVFNPRIDSQELKRSFVMSLIQGLVVIMKSS